MIPFLAAIWGLFLAVDIHRISRPVSSYLDLRAGVSTLSVLLFYTALYTDANPHHHKWMGLITLVLGVIYLLTALVAFRERAGRATSGPRYVVTAIALLAIATAVQCKDFTLASLWAVEAAALVWCSLRWKLRAVSICSIALLAASAIPLVSTDGAFAFEPLRSFHIVANQRSLAYVVLAASMAVSGIMFRRSDSRYRALADVLDYAWISTIFTVLTVETNDFFRHAVYLKPGPPWAAEEPRTLTLAIVWGLYSIPLFWRGIRRSLAPMLTCGICLVVLTTGVSAIAAISYGMVKGYQPFINLRVLTLLVVMLILTGQRMITHKRVVDLPWLTGVLHFLDMSVAALGFELLTLEIVDYFLPALRALPQRAEHIELIRNVILCVAYSAYSILITLYGLRKKSIALVGCALAVSAIAALAAAFGCSQMDPTKSLAPLLTIRTLGFATVVAGILVQRVFLRRQTDHQWTTEALPWLPSLLAVFDISVVLLGFELVTLEILYYFVPALRSASGTTAHIELVRNVALAAAYSAYAIIVTLYGIQRKSNALVACALIVSAVAVFTAAIGCSMMDPVKCAPPLTVRTLGFAAVFAGLLLQQACLRRRRDHFPWTKDLLGAIPVVISLMVFELLTVETWSFFSQGVKTDAALALHHAANLRQMALSVVWLVYSIFLLGYGIWRRMAALRYVAIGVFEMSILKVFLYDLSFLETLYRIFSFIALGIILLATSYLYTRFKSLIVNTPEAAEE